MLFRLLLDNGLMDLYFLIPAVITHIFIPAVEPVMKKLKRSH